MNTRLTINLRDGLLEVEGEESFVRSIYQDFRDQVVEAAALKAVPVKPLEQLEQSSPESPTTARASRVRRNSGEGGKSKSADYKPNFKHHNLAELGTFYDVFAPSSHNEKILCFAIFLRDHLNIAPCTADDIYTCYFTLKTRTKTPEAFQQAFITAKSRTHFIEVEWPEKIEVTIAGDNFYNERFKSRALK